MPIRGPSQYADEPADRLLDDFETADANMPKIAGRNGFWVLGVEPSSADGGADAYVGSWTAESSGKCAARGLRAGHFHGTRGSLWGANWTGLLEPASNDVAGSWDGRAYNGVSFWAAVAPGGGAAPVDVSMGIMTMDNIWNGGVCNVQQGGQCQDAYQTKVPLTTAWRRFSYRFDDLKQAGFGNPLTPMRRDQLVGFIIWPTHTAGFDIWIDDLRFEP